MKLKSEFFLPMIQQGQSSFNLCTTQLPHTLARAAQVLISALQMGRKVLTCGNGGSAGDAQHFASELVNRFESERVGLAALSLVPDSSVVTAIANDYHYDVVFSRQVEAIGREGDVLVVFSTSGNSHNVVKAVEAAHARKMIVIALTGKDGGQIACILEQFDVEIRAPADSTARVQEIHLLTIHCLCRAIDEYFTEPVLTPLAKVQPDSHILADFTQGIRPLVFTNGVFDILHRGHIAYLQKARSMGACLIVGINTDASVVTLGKGHGRPVQCEDDRAHIIASLACVDFVTFFEENTPLELIKTLAPDVLVKGGDYSTDNIVGADYTLARGGRVESIDFEYERSSSEIIKSIQTIVDS